jgi:hypothetical protein
MKALLGNKTSKEIEVLVNQAQIPSDLAAIAKPEIPIEIDSKVSPDKINKYELWKTLNKVYFDSLENFGLAKQDEETRNHHPSSSPHKANHNQSKEVQNSEHNMFKNLLLKDWLKTIISSKYCVLKLPDIRQFLSHSRISIPNEICESTIFTKIKDSSPLVILTEESQKLQAIVVLGKALGGRDNKKKDKGSKTQEYKISWKLICDLTINTNTGIFNKTPNDASKSSSRDKSLPNSSFNPNTDLELEDEIDIQSIELKTAVEIVAKMMQDSVEQEKYIREELEQQNYKDSQMSFGIKDGMLNILLVLNSVLHP